MAEFLLFCASEMERIGAKYGHLHLGDGMKEFEKSPHFRLGETLVGSQLFTPVPRQ